MKKRIKVIQVGLGQIGLAIAEGLLSHSDRFELLGCVDSSPDLAGRKLNDFLKSKIEAGLFVTDSIASLTKKNADVVILSTLSFLPEVAEQTGSIIDRGYNVVTTAEEMFFLRGRDPKLYRRLDAMAKRKGVRILATGINPGYVMDSLVLMLTAPCISVDNIRAERVVNLSNRRLALQRKLGIGLSSKEFIESAAENKFGHAGLVDSARFLAHYLSFQPDNLHFDMQPVVADYDYKGEEIFVAKDHVLGVRHEATVEQRGKTVLSLRLTMRIDASIEYDAVFVDGVPPVHVVINNGIMGDLATVGLILNQLTSFLELQPGYHDMSEVRIPRFDLTSIR